MSNPPGPPGAPTDQSALSLLVNAADNEPRAQRDGNAQAQAQAMSNRNFADSLRLRGLAGGGGGGGADNGGVSLEEQLLLQQQGFGNVGAPAGGAMGLLSQLRDQSILSQLGQQQQLAALLGLGGGAPAPAPGNDIRAALAAAQFRQSQQQAATPQLTHADLLALSRSGGLSGLSGMLGGAGAPGFAGLGAAGAGGGAGGASAAAGLQSELEGLQRLEELERRQRLLAATAGSPSMGAVRPGGEPAPEAPPASLTRPDHHDDPGADRGEPAGAATAAAAAAKSPAAAALGEGAAAAGVAEASKEELEKAPGSVIVPCRARGMPMDHNFKTAYFVIPENVKHGEELICSYFACRNAGIKFRYCSHCKVPVAKRNFRKRHKHGGEDIPKGAGDDSGGEDEVPANKGRGIPSQIMAKREEEEDGDAISSQSADSDNNPNEKPHKNAASNAAEVAVQQGLVRSSMRTFESSKQIKDGMGGLAAAAAAAPRDEKISEERQRRWMTLLAKRPSTKDGDSMSSWLMEVLAVSDLDTPLKVDESGTMVSDESRNQKNATVEAALKKNGSPPEEPQPSEEAEGEAAPPAAAAAAAASTEGTGADNGYGSSNEESGDDNAAAKDTGAAGVAAFSAGAGIVKKKRPSDLLKSSDGQGSAKQDSSFVSGSFAEWKERKRQKKQSKSGNGPSQGPV